MGSGMSDTVIVSSLITSTTWLIELIFILRTLRITHDNDAHGSFVPSALQSWMFLSHRSKPAFTKGPFSPSGNHCVGVGHSVQGLRYGEDREEKVPITSEKRVNTV